MVFQQRELNEFRKLKLTAIIIWTSVSGAIVCDTWNTEKEFEVVLKTIKERSESESDSGVSAGVRECK